jgi:hypothetical protein
MDKEIISILMVCDNDSDYLNMTERSMCSAVKNLKNKEKYRLEFNFVGLDLSEGQRKRFCQLSREKQFDIRFCDFDMSRIAGFILDDHPNIAITYIKFFADELIGDRSKCIFIDSDTVVVGDIAELWNEDVSGCFLAAANHAPLISASEDSREEDSYFFRDYKYGATTLEELEKDYELSFSIDDGVVVFNLNEIREDPRFKEMGISLALGGLREDQIKSNALNILLEKFNKHMCGDETYDGCFGISLEQMGNFLCISSDITFGSYDSESDLERVFLDNFKKLMKGDSDNTIRMALDTFKAIGTKRARIKFIYDKLKERMLLSESDRRELYELQRMKKITTLEGLLGEIALSIGKVKFFHFKYNALVDTLLSIEYNDSIRNLPKIVSNILVSFFKQITLEKRVLFVRHLITSGQLVGSVQSLQRKILTTYAYFSDFINFITDCIICGKKFDVSKSEYQEIASPFLKSAYEAVEYYTKEKPVILHDSGRKKVFARRDIKALEELKKSARNFDAMNPNLIRSLQASGNSEELEATRQLIQYTAWREKRVEELFQLWEDGIR